jgi:hypothetical protein
MADEDAVTRKRAKREAFPISSAAACRSSSIYFRFRQRQVPLSYFVRSTVSICRLGLRLRPFAEAKYTSIGNPYLSSAAMSQAVHLWESGLGKGPPGEGHRQLLTRRVSAPMVTVISKASSSVEQKYKQRVSSRCAQSGTFCGMFITCVWPHFSSPLLTAARIYADC